MKISIKSFILLFLVFAFAFLFATNLLLDQPPESLFGWQGQGKFKATISTLLSPIKIILIGPLLPFIDFLRQDPDTPPPFYLIGFAGYWSLLAFCIHFILSKLRRAE